jgi:hypothetical protein
MLPVNQVLGSTSLQLEPGQENRSAMYDLLKPYLRFKAKPLDIYLAESADRAAHLDLPTIDEKGQHQLPADFHPRAGPRRCRGPRGGK